jgi:pantothenate kinase
LKEIRVGDSIVKAPTFEHSEQDPVEDAITIDPDTVRVVVSEGNYLVYNKEPWSSLTTIANVLLFVECELEEAERRFVIESLLLSLCCNIKHTCGVTHNETTT